LRDTSSGAERELRGAARRIACFAASAHSASPVVAYAESGGLDPKIHVHQVDTLERVATLEGCASLGITALAFSRDGRYLAVASAAPDPTLALRVAATGETLVKMDLRSEATRVAFDPFDAHRLLVTHARGGVLAAHPGVTLHVVDETYHRVTVTPRPLRVEQESALTCAAWSPDGRVVLGDERGAVFVANPDDGSLIPPPESVRSAVRAALAAEVPQRAVPPPGMRHAWAYAGAGPISSVAFSATRVAVALADSNRLLFFSPFVAHADGEKSKNPRLDIGAEPPARLVKTVALGAGSGGASGIAAVAFAPSFDELVATTTEGAAFVATGFLDGKGILAQEDQPSPFGPGMRTIRESEGDPPVFVGRSGSAMETDAAGAFVSRVMGRVTSGAASAAAAAPDASDASAAASAASPGAVAPALSVAAEAAKQDALKRIEHLRRRLGDVIARNDEADELTRVPRGELLMDETFKAQLVAEGETRVRELRARLERENLVADYMSSKIVAECWDTMQTHGSAIVALNTPGLMVHKYPLKAEDKTARLGRRIAFLRRVELAEQEHFKNRGVAEKEKSGGEEDGTQPEGAFEGDKERAREVASSSDSRVDARSVFDLRVDAPLGEGAAVSKKPSDAASSNPNPATDSYEACLYDPSALYPPRRKISQFSLLQMTVREAKAAFNESFASTEAEKQKFVDKIAEINARIVDIRKELAGHTDDDAPLFECVVDKIEQEEYVLSVKDSELKSTRWLSPEERAAAEAAAEAERERIRAKGENPPEDRALREMMGGRLEKAEEVGVPDELPKPDWMIEIDKEDWNDEQRKQGREFENKAKVYREELAKRRVLLAAELVRLHEESAETVVRHDEMLAEFLVQKLATDQRVAEMEADVVALACEVETALHDDEREEERLALAVDAARETREKTRAACSAFQLELDAARKKRDACDAQNQKLDREFKRDFADADDLFDALHALYKRRKPRKQTGLKRASSFRFQRRLLQRHVHAARHDPCDARDHSGHAGGIERYGIRQESRQRGGALDAVARLGARPVPRRVRAPGFGEHARGDASRAGTSGLVLRPPRGHGRRVVVPTRRGSRPQDRQGRGAARLRRADARDGPFEGEAGFGGRRRRRGGVGVARRGGGARRQASRRAVRPLPSRAHAADVRRGARARVRAGGHRRPRGAGCREGGRRAHRPVGGGTPERGDSGPRRGQSGDARRHQGLQEGHLRPAVGEGAARHGGRGRVAQDQGDPDGARARGFAARRPGRGGSRARSAAQAKGRDARRRGARDGRGGAAPARRARVAGTTPGTRQGSARASRRGEA
jgi:hypothetical protein